MPEAVRNHINVSADGIVPAFHGVGVPAPASFRAQSRKRFGAGHRPVKHAAKTGLVEDLHADAPGRNDAIDCAGARVVARVEVRGPVLCLRGFIHNVGGIRRGRVLGDALRAVSADGMRRRSAMIDIRMKWRSVVPGQRLLSQIQIDEGGETKGQIRARKLCAIRLHELGMRGSGIVVIARIDPAP